MSVPAAARASDYRLITDGQSLNYSPSKTNNYRTMLLQGRGIHSTSVAISGFAWTQLKNRITGRISEHVNRAPITIVIGVGGTTDYTVGQQAADVVASEVLWANNLRAIATQPIYIIQTTTTPARSFSGPADIQRVLGNALLMADNSGAFDYKVDLTADLRLADCEDETYYSDIDGTHPTAAGAQVIAELLTPSLEAILAL